MSLTQRPTLLTGKTAINRRVDSLTSDLALMEHVKYYTNVYAIDNLALHEPELKIRIVF